MIQLSSLEMKRLLLLLILPVLLLSLVSDLKIAAAQEESTADPVEAKKPRVEMLECKVKVVDPDGFAVEDATVFCTGLRSREDPVSHWGWSGEKLGKPPRIKTDSQGIAIMPYPKQLSEEFSTGKMTWTVEHPAFVNYRRDHSVDDDPAVIEMERGFRIALTAKNAETGENLKTNLHAETSFRGGGKWELKKNGTFVSSVLKKQDGILRIAYFEDGKPTLFSNEIKIEPGDKSRLLLKDVELSAGCRVEGELEASVPRPVVNGYVIAKLYKRPDSKNRNSLRWSDEAKIAEDGTFVFDSLPKDEVIQMLPICDGFAPTKPKLEDVLAALPVVDPDQVKRKINIFSATPQLLKSDGDKVTVKLPMYKAPSVTVTVVDQDDNPIENAGVAAVPNQYWFQAGSQMLGRSYATRKIWKQTQAGEDTDSYNGSHDSPYQKTTDENGVARLKNMPKGHHRISVFGAELEMAVDPATGRRGHRIQVGDEDHEITIKMFPKAAPPKKDPPSE